MKIENSFNNNKVCSFWCTKINFKTQNQNKFVKTII